MAESYERHDISDNLWTLIEPHTIGNEGIQGSNAKDTRKFINAVFLDTSHRYALAWLALKLRQVESNVNRRFCRWCDKGMPYLMKMNALGF